MKALGIIPARYASTRFPGKPLIDIRGKSMVQRVYEQASACKSLSGVYIATDDQRIFDHVKGFGGKVIMTSPNHQSGTDRCNDAVNLIPSEKTEDLIVVNIQGDEPFLDPEQIDLLMDCFKENPQTQIATLIKKIENTEELVSPNIVKAVINKNSEAIYFSRQPIPYYRNQENEEGLLKHNYFKHVGIYAYQKNILAKITKLEPSPLELAESLEQLRWIENGFMIQTKLTTFESIAIDTPDDLKKVINKI